MVESFGRRRLFEKESLTRYDENVYEEKHRLLETRIAEVGAVIGNWVYDANMGKCIRRLNIAKSNPYPITEVRLMCGPGH